MRFRHFGLALLTTLISAAAALPGTACAQLFPRPSAGVSIASSQAGREPLPMDKPAGPQAAQRKLIDDDELVAARKKARDASLARALEQLRKTHRTQLGAN